MKKKVLFLCQGNACQSQIAEGLLNHFYGNKYEVHSAGINPTDVDKNAIEVMKEIGIDISKQTSKHVNKFLNQKFDVIITFCDVDEKTCPNLFAEAIKNYKWEYFDPSEGLSSQKDLLKALREVRDDIKTEIVKKFK